MGRRGYFEDLDQYNIIGFNRDNKEGIGYITNVQKENGIFYWSNNVIEKIEKANLYSCNGLVEKQLVMVGFLLELGYDLMINSDDNVSKSPGFEPCLGIFGGEK